MLPISRRLYVSVCLLDVLMSPTKTDEPIDMPFGLWTRVGPTVQRTMGAGIPPESGTVLECPGLMRSIGNIRRE